MHTLVQESNFLSLALQMSRFIQVTVFSAPVLLPALSFACNLALCKLFPVWGNYITLGLALTGGTATTLFVFGDNQPRTPKSLSLGLGLLIGLGVAAAIGFPVGIKIGIAIVVKIVGMLVSYSDT